MLPKLMSAVRVRVIGDTITAVAVAVAEDCANAPAVNARRTIEKVMIFFIFSLNLIFTNFIMVYSALTIYTKHHAFWLHVVL
jgi:hypothetical protein